MNERAIDSIPLQSSAIGTSASDGVRLAPAVARFYAEADIPMRVTLLRALLRPVGPLALAGIAAGAFAALLPRTRWQGALVTPETAAGIGAEAVMELVLYVEQKAPELLAHLPALIGESGAWMATVSGALLLLALHTWRRDRG